MKRRLLRICALLGALSIGAGAAAEGVDLLEVDHRLYELGYRDGACSGELDDVMVNALRNFQHANGLGITGNPDAGTVLVLSSDAAVSQADYLARLSQESATASALAPGSYGEEVVLLQRALQELGYFAGSADGSYAETTVLAVNRFQLANGLQTTGIADGSVTMRLYSASPITWEEFLLSCTAAAGDSGATVRRLQHWLGYKGYFEGECTGKYGEGTQRAVRQLQTEFGLDPSGDADVETCRALFSDIDSLLAEAAALRRGDAGAAQLCSGLTALGYPAHEEFDMQTELALMQFQRANALPVTGMADAAVLDRLEEQNAVGIAGYVASGAEAALDEGFSALGYPAHEEFDMQTELALMQFQRANALPVTGMADAAVLDRLEEQNAVGIAGYVASGAEAALDEGFSARLVRQAARVLGELSGFDDDFALVQYVYLKCGVAVVNRSQFLPAGTDLREAAPGDMMVLTTEDGEICGVTASDGALIYRAEDGRILMGYPESMGYDAVQLYRLVSK